MQIYFARVCAYYNKVQSFLNKWQ